MAFKTKKISAAVFIASALFAASWGAHAGDTATVTITGNIVDTTCTPSWGSSGIVVNLGTVAGADFGGQHKSAATKDFTLDLKDCGDSIKGMTVTAQGDADTADPDGYKNTGDATGVAVEVHSGSTTMDAAGVNSVTATPTEGAASIPFQASMVQSGDSMPGNGAVSSVVTLNVSYN